MQRRRFHVVAGLFLLLFAAAPVMARQNQFLYGQVVSAADGAPIKDAWVVSLDTGDAQPTDATGVFRVAAHLITSSETKRSGGLFGMLTGFSKETTTMAMDPNPRLVMAWAPGYKPMLGSVDWVAAGIGRQSTMVLNRIALARVNAAGEPHESAGRAHHPGPLASAVSVDVTPNVLIAPKGKLTIRAVIDAPSELPLGCKIYAFLSDGEKLGLQQQNGRQPETTQTYEGNVALPNRPDLLEVTVCSVLLGRLQQSWTIGGWGGLGGILDLASLAVGASHGFRDTDVIARTGHVLVESRFVAVAPGASPDDMTALSSLTSALNGSDETVGAQTADIAAVVSKLSPGDLQQTLAPAVALRNATDEESLRTLARKLGIAAATPAGKTFPLLSRAWAMTAAEVAAETNQPEDLQNAHDALAAAMQALSHYGPGIREIAMDAFVLKQYDLAAQGFDIATKLLGDADDSIGLGLRQKQYKPFGSTWSNLTQSESGALGRAAKALDGWDKRRSDKDWLSAARDLQNVGMIENAKQAVQKAIDIKPTGEAWNLFGLLCADGENRNDLEVAAYRKATELDPKLAVAWYNLGYTLWENGQRDAAVAPLINAGKIDRGTAQYQRAAELAQAWQDAGKNPSEAEKAAVMFRLDDGNLPSEAVAAGEMARAALKQGPAPWAEWVLAKVALQAGDATEAAKHIDAAAALAPNEPMVAVLRIYVALQKDDFAGAARSAEQTLALRNNRITPVKDLKNPWVQSLLNLRDGDLLLAQRLAEMEKREGKA